MDDLMFKIYKGKSKDHISTTNNILNALRKYFIYSQENSVMEIWKNKRLIGEYKKKTRDVEEVINDLKDMIHAL